MTDRSSGAAADRVAGPPAKGATALLRRLWRSWVSVSLVGGLVGTVFDLSLVVLLVQLAHFNAAAAAPLGVALGSTANFAFNKIFAFRHVPGQTHHQYFRFLAGMAVAATLHAGLVDLLTNRWGVYYVLSKLIADVLVFTGGNLLILRFFVFPHGNARAVEPSRMAGACPEVTSLDTEVSERQPVTPAESKSPASPPKH